MARVPMSALRKFLELESAGGILLVAAAALALLFANAPITGPLYETFLEMRFEVRVGVLHLEKDLLHLVNDGLMAIFFLIVALELKREMLAGELSRPSQIALPGLAAVGGVLLPAVIYAGFTWGDSTALRGWAIPAATDIAFSLGVLSLLGRRVPQSMKVFLTTLAVLDDLAAIVIIALFYTHHLSVSALWLGVACLLVLVLLNRLGVQRLGAYFVVGAVMWLSVLESGVHATLAGVALGLTIPMSSRHSAYSPLRSLEHALHPWVAYGILPLFAFANAGVSFGGDLWAVLVHPVTLGIAVGLVIGKTVGVFGFMAATIKLGLAELPRHASWAGMFGLAWLTGIGFTMSLFIGTLAFTRAGPEYAVATRVGVLGGSLIAALIGFHVLTATLPRQPRDNEREAAPSDPP